MIQSFYRFANALALARGRDPDHPPHLQQDHGDRLMPVALVNGRVLGDSGIEEGRAVLLDGSRIADVVADDDPRVAGRRTTRPRRQAAAAGFPRHAGQRRRRRAVQRGADGRRDPRDRPGASAVRHDRFPADADQRRPARRRARARGRRRGHRGRRSRRARHPHRGPVPQRRCARACTTPRSCAASTKARSGC